MCGICGFTYNDASLINRMNDSIRHRGPDDEGVFVNEYISLGHRRLAIIDLSASAHQPMSNGDKNLWIVFNGEIYNYKDIRLILEDRGYKFRTNSDTEVILHSYEEWGTACLQKFCGMFAFAIWDIKKGELFMARDRLGVKPFYYVEKSGNLFFASEIKAFKDNGIISNELDYNAVNLFFTFRFTPGTQTVLKEVKKLDPGHFMIWKKDSLKIQKYWDIELDDSTTKQRSTEEYVEEFLTIFKDAVRLRLVSDVPVGAYLSGGLDSSFIVGIMAGMTKKQVKTFSVGFPEGKDESAYSRQVAEYFHTDHHLLNVKTNAVEIIPDVIRHLDEPLSDAATIPTYLMSQITKREATVVLSGEGADEQLGGYDKYKVLYYPYLLKNCYPKSIFKVSSRNFSAMPRIYRGMEYLGNLNNPVSAYLRFYSVFLSEDRMKLFSSEKIRSEVSNGSDLEIIGKYLNGSGDFLNRLLLLDLKTWLPDDLLLKNDRMTMAHAVEARNPFLDHRLVEFLIKVPGSLKLRWFREKYLLRVAMKGIVPGNIIRRKKQGFSVPIHRWVENGLAPMIHDLFSKKHIDSIGFINHNAVKNLAERDLTNPYNLRQFWTLFSFLAWHKHFLNGHR